MPTEEKKQEFRINGKVITFPHTIKLQYPIDKGTDIELKELIFKNPPTWKDMEHIKGDASGTVSMDMLIPITSRLTGTPVTSLQRILAIDSINITEFLNPFLGL